MITAYQFVPAWGLPDLSPFCIKLDTYLAMAGLPHTIAVGDVRKAPRHKLPYIDDDGNKVSDSGHIIEALKQKYGDALDSHLTAQQRAIGTAVQSMVEEHMYFVLLYLRWKDDAGWAAYKGSLAEYGRRIGVPGFFAPILLHQARSGTLKKLQEQGTGRHTPAEICALGKRHLTVISDILGAQPFLLGDKPTSFDATVYAFLVSLLDPPIPSAVRDFGLTLQNLIDYCKRMQDRFKLTRPQSA